jgi:hypothetical protein
VISHRMRISGIDADLGFGASEWCVAGRGGEVNSLSGWVWGNDRRKRLRRVITFRSSRVVPS